jgi:ABC-type multidrug transport system fused ATPase/permease subunit
LRRLPSANRTIGLLQTISFYRPDLEAVWADTLEPIEDLEERPEGVLPPPFANALRLEDVTAQYANSARTIFRGVNLEVCRGDKIAIVGRSGSGKTTLLNMILGFVPLQAGQILFDERGERPFRRYRCSATAFVPQDICLLDDTVLANVTFGELDQAREEDRVWSCLEMAQLAEHVRSLPDGLRTQIGEGGAKISGGEKQRLAIARALYQAPAFLILDEATSQLDLEAERAILEGLFLAIPDLTVIMATHRAGNMAIFTRRLVLSEGRLVETDIALSRQPPNEAA